MSNPTELGKVMLRLELSWGCDVIIDITQWSVLSNQCPIEKLAYIHMIICMCFFCMCQRSNCLTKCPNWSLLSYMICLHNLNFVYFLEPDLLNNQISQRCNTFTTSKMLGAGRYFFCFCTLPSFSKREKSQSLLRSSLAKLPLEITRFFPFVDTHKWA